MKSPFHIFYYVILKIITSFPIRGSSWPLIRYVI